MISKEIVLKLHALSIMAVHMVLEKKGCWKVR